MFLHTCYKPWFREEKLNGIFSGYNSLALLFSPFSLHAQVEWENKFLPELLSGSAFVCFQTLGSLMCFLVVPTIVSQSAAVGCSPTRPARPVFSVVFISAAQLPLASLGELALRHEIYGILEKPQWGSDMRRKCSLTHCLCWVDAEHQSLSPLHLSAKLQSFRDEGSNRQSWPQGSERTSLLF